MFSFPAEAIFHIGIFKVTNSLINTIFVDFLILIGSLFITKNIRIIPGLFQNVVEITIQSFYEVTQSVSGENAKKIFPYLMGFFIFILISNWSGLLPGVSSIGFFETYEGHKKLIPLVRVATSDINTTLGLALVSVIATHIMSIKTLGIADYLSRFFSLNPINLFIGVLEIISEITKVISLSFRLFGNIFAGEIVLLTTAGIFAYFFPIPFMLLEIIVGLVQALVFGMLTMTFMAVLTAPHHEAKAQGEN